MKWYWYIVIQMFVMSFSCSCSNPEPQLGDYVYVDKYNILHAKHDCPAVASVDHASAISRISVNDISCSYDECSLCVTDNIHDSIEHLIELHLEHLKELNLEVYKYRKKWHDFIVSEGFEVPDFDQFVEDMRDDENMHRLHQNLVNLGYDMPDYNHFRYKFGY